MFKHYTVCCNDLAKSSKIKHFSCYLIHYRVSPKICSVLRTFESETKYLQFVKSSNQR